MLPEDTLVDSFTLFVKETEPKMKVALCAAFGAEVGVEATADALRYGWEHWARIRTMDNPSGYLWTVGRNRARRLKTEKRPMFEPELLKSLPWVEPALPAALADLSEKQRLSVMLIYGLDWTFGEVADLMGVSRSTVQKHAERAMTRLRRKLGVI